MGKNTQSLKSLREFSAGGVVFKKENDKVFWLVTKVAVGIFRKPLHATDTWRLPKGWLDDARKGKPGVVGTPGPLTTGEKKATEEELQKAAIKEVQEEGGVEAKIVAKVGTSKFFFNSTRGRVLKFVTFYLVEWVRDLPEGTDFETSEVAWLPYKEAFARLTYPGEKEVLKKAKRLI